MSTIEAHGHNGTVTFDGNFITIIRRGGLARLTVGKGEKRIPISSVTAVQWKPPGSVVNGFIQFTIGGGNESRSKFGSQTMDAVNDENSVIVMKKHAEEFLALRTAVEAAVVTRHQPQVIHAAPQATRLDQLKQLGELRQSGVLSDEEFETEKAKLMDVSAEATPVVASGVGPAAAEQLEPNADQMSVRESSEDAAVGGSKAGRIAGAVATGGLSEVARFGLKKRKNG